MNKSLKCLTLSLLAYALTGFADTDDADYCRSQGGSVTPMTAWYSTNSGEVEGWTKPFCTFQRDRGFIVVGLETFSSTKPNIAASYMKTLSEIDGDSLLFKGGAGNPSYNVCKNLGGTVGNYKIRTMFRPKKGGDSDICVFGDGSMISSWSLIYMANHRAGYDAVKNSARSSPLAISVE